MASPNALKAQQLRTVWIKQADPEDMIDALELLRKNQALTAGESGTIAYDPIANATLMGTPMPVWDGIFWNMFIFLTSD